jgi:hypothetical protein
MLDRKPWAALIAAVGVVFVIQLLTLRVQPTVFQDEVQIIDYGRTALDPSSTWAVSWNVQQSSPILSASWLAVAFQELAYRASRGSLLGPRISAMLGAVLAALCCFGWLRARHALNGLALLLALLLLIDPVFSKIYRQGRVDGFAIAAALGACWLLRLAVRRAATGQSSRAQVFGAAALTAASPFLWATAPALFPLIALEAWYLVKASWTSTPKIGAVLVVLVPGVVGLVIAASLVAIPLAVDWELYSAGMESSGAVQARAAVIQNSVIDLFLVHDPGLSLLVLGALVLCREWGLFIALAAALAIISGTMIYLPRVLYLIPYFLAIVAAAYAHASKPGKHLSLAKSLRYLLAFSLALGITWVLVLRPAVAYMNWPANDPAQVTVALERAIGPGNHRVLLEFWEAYYAGRSLGWVMYRAGSPVSMVDYVEFAATMDFAVLLKHGSYADISRSQLVEAGFVLTDEIDFAQARAITLPLLGFTFPGGGYPSIQVYENARRSTR